MTTADHQTMEATPGIMIDRVHGIDGEHRFDRFDGPDWFDGRHRLDGFNRFDWRHG